MNKFIEKINFKVVVILYIIIALLISAVTMIFIGDKFKSKFEFIYHYHRISEGIEKDNYDMEDIKQKIKNISDKSEDIVDVLILDKENKVIYSSKNSELGQQEVFTLNRKNNASDEYFINPNIENTIFKLTRNKELMITTILSNFDTEIKKDYEDEVFYENNFNAKKLYLLSYAANGNTGEKIYFINEIHPVENGKTYIKIALAVMMFLFMVYWIIVALYVYQNALKSKLNPYLWGGITLFTNLAGVIVYIIYKQNNKKCFKCGALQSKTNMYCVHCGTKLNESCKKCGASINMRDRYCAKCGEKQENIV